MPHVKVADASSRIKLAGIMRRIYDENPSYWPHGLSASHFDPGDAYLVKRAEDDLAIGFVGWQEREKEGARTGYYSVGILPEHRQRGYAKEAVSSLLAQKAAGVDRVRALVEDHNLPSRRLAERLSVPVVKEARTLLPRIGRALLGMESRSGARRVLRESNPRALKSEKFRAMNWFNRFAPAFGMTAGPAVALDAIYNLQQNDSLLPFAGMDKHRLAMMLMNLGFGRIGRALFRFNNNYLKGMGLLSSTSAPIAKDLMMTGTSFTPRMTEGVEGLRGATEKLVERLSAQHPAAGGKTSWWPLAAALGLTGLGTAGAIYASRQKDDGKGRLKVTLPTKNPGDAETVLELPFDQQQALTNALRGKLERDTRRRLYAETNARTYRKGNREPAERATAVLP